MSSIREQIVAAACAALSTGRPAGIPALVRTRIDSPSVDQLPAFTVYQAVENVRQAHEGVPGREGRAIRGPAVKRSILLNVEVLTKADGASEPDKEADPILAWASKALAAAGELGGLAFESPDELGTKFEYEQRETSFCRATMGFQYNFQSRADDPEKKS